MATSAAPHRKSQSNKSRGPVLRAAQVAAAVETLGLPKGTARFASGKALINTAELHPERVYPYFDQLAARLNAESKIVRWGAQHILGRLAAVDADHKLDALLDDYLAPIRGPNLIAAANAIGGAGRIAAARPELLERIVPALLAAGRARYETPECRNVACGAVLDALGRVWPAVRGRADVRRFVQRQRKSTRAAVARRAQKLAAK